MKTSSQDLSVHLSTTLTSLSVMPVLQRPIYGGLEIPHVVYSRCFTMSVHALHTPIHTHRWQKKPCKRHHPTHAGTIKGSLSVMLKDTLTVTLGEGRTDGIKLGTLSFLSGNSTCRATAVPILYLVDVKDLVQKYCFSGRQGCVSAQFHTNPAKGD